MSRTPAPAAFALLLALSACSAPGRAERIGTRSDGGSIMLSANNDKAWDSAKEIMRSHCDGKYRVVAQVQEQARTPGVKPPAAPGPMGDPMDQAGAPYGLRIDYECTGGSGPLDAANPGGATGPAGPTGPTGPVPAPRG